ncbi:MAG: ArsR family transcriptional regulator [Methanothrix sp.]|uniref:ArsR family transcriptional regulator n=1 Tax=Methanothrix sp. TaxID=90426 RepID=UPI0025CF134C|nr:ArsR family transcriptional regulator [Methanothrix sp.]MCQ8904006.1 ArsR family transcriptional regulator [Methanothrix sp.]
MGCSVNGKRTRIINDPSDLVPLLQVFGSESHKRVFDKLCDQWLTERELVEIFGDNDSVSQSIELLRKSGLIETKWRVPEPGKSPEKEYHSAFSRVQANFFSSMEDLSDLIRVTFMSDEELRDITEKLREKVSSGMTSISTLSRDLGKSQMYLKAVAKRAKGLTVRGQRIELSED